MLVRSLARKEGGVALSTLQDFLGAVCSVCRQPKVSNRSFCGRCYHALPKNMQNDLWRRFGSGYEGAFAAAQAWLRERRPQHSLDF
jgi:hypothetical protein